MNKKLEQFVNSLDEKLTKFDTYMSNTKWGLNSLIGDWKADVLVGLLSTGVFYFAINVMTAPDSGSYSSLIYEDTGDSLMLYSPKPNKMWHERTATKINFPIGMVAKKDVEYIEKLPFSHKYKPVLVKGSSYALGTRGSDFRYFLEDGEMTQNSIDAMKKYLDEENSLPDFSEIKNVKVYGARNKDDFFKEIKLYAR